MPLAALHRHGYWAMAAARRVLQSHGRQAGGAQSPGRGRHSMRPAPVPTPALPAHIRPDSVRHCELFDRRIVYENPYAMLIPRIHEGPAVFYADNILVGPKPGWVVRRNAALRNIYADTEHFHKRGNSGFAQMI